MAENLTESKTETKTPDPTPPPEPVKGPTCPTCKGPLAIYSGDNAFKQGTGFCDICGERTPLKR